MGVCVCVFFCGLLKHLLSKLHSVHFIVFGTQYKCGMNFRDTCKKSVSNWVCRLFVCNAERDFSPWPALRQSSVDLFLCKHISLGNFCK